MNNNTVISRTETVFETPPGLDDLKKMDRKELRYEALNLGISRESIDNIKDDDKQKVFLVKEILRIRPPVPQTFKPVLLKEDFNPSKMEKTVSFKYVKHLFDDAKKYQKSVVSIESYIVPLQYVDIDNQTKNNLLQSIQQEVDNLNLDEYSSKEKILEFACDNSKSNTEKRRRATALQKILIVNNYKRHRITTYDISAY